MAGDWLNVRQAAEHIGAKAEFIYDACAVKGLRHVRLGGKRNIRLRPEWLDEWMSEFEVVNAGGQLAA